MTASKKFKHDTMKFFKYFTFILAGVLLFACDDEYIDPISSVNPGADESAPAITMEYPVEGTQIQVVEETTDIVIKYEATDDIELSTIKVSVDGTELVTRTEFKDYRRVIDEVLYEGLENGSHTVEVVATDIDGKTTSVTVNFDKVSPYDPLYDGEVLYMPFDNDFTELVALRTVNVHGSPGFAGETILDQGDAYAGATDAYLTLDGTAFHNDEFSAAFWMKVNAVPDRAGILVMGPEDEANPTAQNNRASGFRFFRENAGGMQRFKLNVGRGDGDSWFDGGAAADVDPTADEWVHFAFTISQTESIVYIDGQVVKQGTFDGVDWTGCDILSIMSGEPRFTGWNHRSDLSYMDELRIFNKALSQSEIQTIIANDRGGGTGYTPKFDGESFYAPFDGNFRDMVTGAFATEVGSPGFAGEGKGGTDAYAGATDSYLTFPAADYIGDEFSAAFWFNINAEPDRAGILVIGPPDPDNPDAQNDRSSGFRFFRENAGGMQRFKLNVGNGAGDTWFDGGMAADVDPTTDEWVHLAFTISQTDAVVYINGEVVKQDAFDGVDWTDCDLISVMSGTPHFTGWNHRSDLSWMDELRFFNKFLSQEEVMAVMDDAN
jgi:hypothetical protein